MYLCSQLLEQLQAVFGRVAIRSAYRFCSLNAFDAHPMTVPLADGVEEVRKAILSLRQTSWSVGALGHNPSPLAVVRPQFGEKEPPQVIAHLSIGVKDIDRSKRFYDAALAPLGYKCIRPAKALIGYGYGVDIVSFWVVLTERPVMADEKSGLHICFAAPNAPAVDAFHAAALRSGGQDNGAPGLRPHYSPDYYAAFVIDPDGYRLEAYFGPGER